MDGRRSDVSRISTVTSKEDGRRSGMGLQDHSWATSKEVGGDQEEWEK